MASQDKESGYSPSIEEEGRKPTKSSMLPRQIFSAYQRASTEASNDYRYCPLCGTGLSGGTPDSAQRPRCTRCGWVHYKNPAPGVVVLIEEGGRVLLGRRAEGTFEADKWCLPGGFIEFDEDFLRAGIREVLEETGLRAEIRSILNVSSNFLSPDLHTLVIVLLAGATAGTAVPGDDLCELRWFPLDEPFPEMAFEADQHIIERYRQTELKGLSVDPLHRASR